MSRTKIHDVQPGMEVVNDVLDAKGNVLLKKGSTLSQVWIERLKKRGISELEVSRADETETAQTADSDVTSKKSDMPYDDLQEHMKKIFAPVLGNPRMKVLARATYMYMKSKS